jgi:S-adenosylmethionine:tRNA-ribosyltransferase-isomerase (queuine synthetase)
VCRQSKLQFYRHELELHFLKHVSRPQETIDLILATKARGNKVIAIGTTATRALESAAQAHI